MAIRFNRLPDQNTPIAPVAAAPKPAPRGPQVRAASLALIALALLVGLGMWYWNSTMISSTARVRALELRVAPAQASRITKLLVSEGDTVRAGQPLVELSSDELEQAIAMAEARLDARRAVLAQLEATSSAQSRPDPAQQSQAAANVARAEQNRLMASAEAEEAKTTSAMRDTRLQELKRLLALGAVTRAEYEKAAQEAAVWRGRLRTAQLSARAAARSAELSQAAAQGADGGPSGPSSALVNLRTDAKLAEVELATLRGNRAGLTLSVPIDGVVTAIHRRAGEVAKLGEVILTVTNPRQLWLEGFLETADLPDVLDGQRVVIKLPANAGGGERTGRLSLTWNEPVNEYDTVPVGRREARNPQQLPTTYRPFRVTLDVDGQPVTDGLQAGQTVRINMERAP